MNYDDRLLSIRHLVYTTFQDRIVANTMRQPLTEGRVSNMARPIWSIRRINHREQDLGKAGYIDIDQWSLFYAATNRQDADLILETFKQAVKNGGRYSRWSDRIPGWRFNWQYPQPIVTQLISNGNLVGTYEIRVSGIDLCDNESAASVPLLVTMVAPSNTLSIRILRQPFLAPLFKSYNVYVNGHLVTNILHPTAQLYPVAVVGSINPSGAVPKEPINNRIRWKFIRVDTYSESVREDDITDGLFNATVTMQTSTYQEKKLEQQEAVWNIGATQTIAPPSPPAIAVGPYLVQRTNTVKVGY